MYYTLISDALNYNENTDDLSPKKIRNSHNKNNSHSFYRNKQNRQTMILKKVELEAKDQGGVLTFLNKLGFRGKREIYKSFLEPQYLHSQRKILQGDRLQIKLAIGLVFVTIKIVLPFLIYIRKVEFSLVLLCFMIAGFYLHFALLIFELIDSNDI